MPVLYKPMNGIFLHKPYESTNICFANGRNVNVPNETCLSNTRNYTNINKHYCVSMTVSAAADVLPGGAGVFFAVTFFATRVPISSCILDCIRKKFQSEDGNYVGFL